MTREEFENRMGNKVTPEAWESIQELFYNCTEIIDWEDFADDYKLHGTSKILADIWRRFLLKKNVLKIRESEVMLAAEKLIELAGDDDDAYTLAVKIAGARYVVTYKLEQGKTLNQADIDYICDNLK